MVYFVLFILEIWIMYFLSRKISIIFSNFLSINIFSFLFLPGVIIHELSHMLIAVALFVPVGHMEFSAQKNEGGIKLGSVEIARTDPIRRSIIGFAPVFLGLMLIVAIVYFFSTNISFFQNTNIYIFSLVIFFVGYLLFAISNTMFSSKKDMEGALEILITLAILFLIAYVLGFRISFSYVGNIFNKEVVSVIQKSSIFLLAPLIMDVAILSLVRFIKKS